MKNRLIKNKRVHVHSLCNFFPKNRKGDIPITILVIGVVAICILAVLSFFGSLTKVQSKYLGIELIEEINADVEKFYFYVNAGFSEEDAAEKINAKIIGNQLLIERKKQFEKGKFLSVNYTRILAD